MNSAASWLATIAAAGCASSHATAQDYTYLLITDYGPGESSVHPGNPDATVRVYATPRESDYAWANGNLDLEAGEAGWTAFALKLISFNVYGERGTLSGDGRTVEEIIVGQFNAPVFLEFANSDHPILIWEGTWSNASGDFSPRSVALTTSGTTFYRVYLSQFTAMPTDVLSQFVPGSGAITITPAPGSVAAMILLAGLATRRRRAGPS